MLPYLVPWQRVTSAPVGDRSVPPKRPIVSGFLVGPKCRDWCFAMQRIEYFCDASYANDEGCAESGKVLVELVERFPDKGPLATRRIRLLPKLGFNDVERQHSAAACRLNQGPVVSYAQITFEPDDLHNGLPHSGKVEAGPTQSGREQLQCGNQLPGFGAQTLHQPEPATCLPGKMLQGAAAESASPVYSAQLLQKRSPGRSAGSALVASATYFRATAVGSASSRSGRSCARDVVETTLRPTTDDAAPETNARRVSAFGDLPTVLMCSLQIRTGRRETAGRRKQK